LYLTNKTPPLKHVLQQQNIIIPATVWHISESQLFGAEILNPSYYLAQDI